MRNSSSKHYSRRNFSPGRRKSSGGVRQSGGRSRFSGRGGAKLSPLDISSFINKAAEITEKTERFIPEHQFSDFKIDGRILETLKKADTSSRRQSKTK
jgi:hypothetical protein